MILTRLCGHLSSLGPDTWRWSHLLFVEIPEEELAKMEAEPKPKEADEVGHEVEAEHRGEMSVY